MTHTRKRQNIKTKRRNPKSRVTKRHKKKTNRRKRGGRALINPCDTAISTNTNADIKAYAKHLCNEQKSFEQLKKNTLSTKTHNTCKDFLKSPEPDSNCKDGTCKNIKDCIDDAEIIYKNQEQRLHDLINTNMKEINIKMKEIEDNMFIFLKDHEFDFDKISVQNYLYGQIYDLTSINLFNEKSGENESCHDINDYCVVSQKIFLTIVLSHLRFYTEHDLNNEKQSLLTMISKNADAIKKIIPYHINDKSLIDGLTLLQEKVPELRQ